ncbi:hypothetical protein [Nostoc sp.]
MKLSTEVQDNCNERQNTPKPSIYFAPLHRSVDTEVQTPVV